MFCYLVLRVYILLFVPVELDKAKIISINDDSSIDLLLFQT